VKKLVKKQNFLPTCGVHLFSMMKLFSLIHTALLMQSSLLVAADWPQFRGPGGVATAAAENLPVPWDKVQDLAWKYDLPGPGCSSPIIVGQRVFLTAWSGYGDKAENTDPTKLMRHLLCLSLKEGKLLWQKDLPNQVKEDAYEGFITEHGYATNTPVSDGEWVYAFLGKSGIYAFDGEGNQKWHRQLGTGSSDKAWGSAASPILYGDKLIINATDESKALYALDKRTGQELWKAGSEKINLGYSTPSLCTDSQGRTDLVYAHAEEVWGLNPDTGKLRWFATHGLPSNISPSVVQRGDTITLYGGFPTQGSVCVKLGGSGDVTATHILWQSKTVTYVPTPVMLGDHFYFINHQGFAHCVNALTGEDVFRERVIEGGKARGKGQPFYSSPVLLGDHVLQLSRRSGAFWFKAQPGFEKPVQLPALDDGQFHATPAIAGPRLLLRSDKALYCLCKTALRDS
jgi:outer membrane protein assembly factor BamB